MVGSEMASLVNQSHEAEQEILGLCEPQLDSDVQGTGGGGREVGVAVYLA